MVTVNNLNTFPPLDVNIVAIGSRCNRAISGQGSVQMVSLWNLKPLHQFVGHIDIYRTKILLMNRCVYCHRYMVVL